MIRAFTLPLYALPVFFHRLYLLSLFSLHAPSRNIAPVSLLSLASYLRDRAHFSNLLLPRFLLLPSFNRYIRSNQRQIHFIYRGRAWKSLISLIVGDGVKFSANTIAAKVTKRWRCLLCRDKSIDRREVGASIAQTIKNFSIDACILEDGLIINKEYR